MRAWMSHSAAIAVMAMTFTILPCLPHTGGAPSFGAEDTKNIRHLRGRITGVNFAGNTISVEWLYGAFDPAKKIITFSYSDSIKVSSDRRPIFAPVRPIGIVDLVIGDHVLISYYEPRESGRLIATKIRVFDIDIPRTP